MKYLQKKYECKVVFVLLYFNINIVKIKTSICKQRALSSKLAVLSNFEALTPIISKNETQFAIICFCKESKSSKDLVFKVLSESLGLCANIKTVIGLGILINSTLYFLYNAHSIPLSPKNDSIVISGYQMKLVRQLDHHSH